jgi:hypothetical protein
VPAASVSALVKELLKARHGREDFTIITQEDMLRTLSGILDVLTMAVGALGSISLLVGGVGIVTIMTIAVTERTSEIGLLVALGAPRRTILGLFLGEAVALAALGGVVGLLLGIGLAQLIHLASCRRCRCIRRSFVVLAEALAIAIGLAAGVLPARRAAKLDPVEALRAESSKTVTEADIVLCSPAFPPTSTPVSPRRRVRQDHHAFGGRIAHGMLSASFISAVLAQQAAWTGHHLPVANPEVQGPGSSRRHRYRPPSPSSEVNRRRKSASCSKPCAKSVKPW